MFKEGLPGQEVIKMVIRWTFTSCMHKEASEFRVNGTFSGIFYSFYHCEHFAICDWLNTIINSVKMLNNL